LNPQGTPRLLGCFLRWFFDRLYTSLAWSYDAVAWLSSLGGWSTWRRTALARLPRGQPALELGFGTGHLQAEAARSELMTFGVDASAQMVRLTRRRLRRPGRSLRIARARSQSLPFRSESFAAVFSTFPSEYIFDPASVAEIGRVLSASGPLVIVLSARIRPRFPWERLTRWLYDLTGQAPGPNPQWLIPFRQAGLDARHETVEVPGASVLLIVASRQPGSTSPILPGASAVG
jgi:ubiquinone/menaquinone biosynthesis C-methylase UbiE